MAGPYLPSRRIEDWVVTSGQLGTVEGPDGHPILVPGGTLAELRQALLNLSSVLIAEGATHGDVFKATVFLTDIEDKAGVDEIWANFFAETPPCRSLVAVAALPMGARVEVEGWAHIGKRWGVSSAPADFA